jgi:hypothetical protein
VDIGAGAGLQSAAEAPAVRASSATAADRRRATTDAGCAWFKADLRSEAEQAGEEA